MEFQILQLQFTHGHSSCLEPAMVIEITTTSAITLCECLNHAIERVENVKHNNVNT